MRRALTVFGQLSFFIPNIASVCRIYERQACSVVIADARHDFAMMAFVSCGPFFEHVNHE